MLKSRECKICGKSVEGHGYQLTSLIRGHIKSAHPNEWQELMTAEDKIDTIKQDIYTKYGNVLRAF